MNVAEVAAELRALLCRVERIEGAAAQVCRHHRPDPDGRLLCFYGKYVAVCTAEACPLKEKEGGEHVQAVRETAIPL